MKEMSRRNFLKLSGVTAGLGMSAMLVGCGNSSAPAGSSAGSSKSGSGELIAVGIINNDPNESGYRAANDKDMKNTFTEENGFKAEFAYSMKNEEQIASAQQFIQNGVKYLLVSAADTAGWDTPLKDAQDAGTQTILFDRVVDADEDLYVASVVSDMAKEGDTAVKWLTDQKLSEYNIVHIQGVMGSAAQVGRTGALDDAVKTNGWNLVVQQTADWNAETAQQITQSVIDSKQPFNVIYAENDDMARGAVAALDASGITHGKDGDVIIMGFDHNTWALEEVMKGTWNFDGQCNPYQASTILDIINQLEAGETPKEKTVILEEGYADCDTITQEYIDEKGI